MENHEPRITLRGWFNRARARRLANEASGLQDANTVDGLMGLLEGEERKRRIKARWILLAYALGMAGMSATIIATRDFFDFLYFIPGVGGAIATAYAASNKQKAAASALAGHEDVRAIGPLVSALGYNDGVGKALTVSALIKLLPQLRADQANLLNDQQRSTLNGLLTVPRDAQSVRLVIAILQAYAQVGDEKAIPFVQKLTQPASRGRQSSAIREAAERCLPALKQRVVLELADRSLLRASSETASASGALLRAATEQNVTTDPLVLLRPDQPPTTAEVSPGVSEIAATIRASESVARQEDGNEARLKGCR